MFQKEKDKDTIEYDVKTAVFRILFLIFLFISLYYLYNFYLSGDVEKVDSLLITEEEIIVIIFEDGFVNSVSNTIFEAEGKIFLKNGIKYFLIDILDSQIEDYILYFSIDSFGNEELYKIGEVEFKNVETEFLFEVPKDVNTSIYSYIIVKNSDTNENYAYLNLPLDLS